MSSYEATRTLASNLLHGWACLKDASIGGGTFTPLEQREIARQILTLLFCAEGEAGIQQDQTVSLYMVYIDGVLDEVFTHKVQAEAYLRSVREDVTRALTFRIVERVTVPHDNHC
jgi:hypothetical protein